MATGLPWTRQQLLVAFALYSRLPFGRLHRGNPDIVRLAATIGRSASSLAMKLTNIASLDPVITSTGRTGLRGASAADRGMWLEMESNSANFPAECETAYMEALGQVLPTSGTLEDEATDHSGEDRIVQSKERIGQSFFRAAVLNAYGQRCCITGLSVTSLLVASHIVPWRQDKQHRLNPRNGLALSALHDRAFDLGLIIINDNMTVRVSANHPAKDDAFFATSIRHYEGRQIHLPQKFGIGEEFLAFHREHIFQN